ncbi:hypothetical protein GCM10018962_07610 [Dactylosporangium matsuzakiense]|uniref:Uncharacterized protein n=1 Tax=Dactylosporangium matsuzakiense TaxID=53360 RepID=A0A9W6KDJ3_9ACTN|nr:hypothetical protein GCM10017581_005140 [Dactylosporangium matsuzakiense]
MQYCWAGPVQYGQAPAGQSSSAEGLSDGLSEGLSDGLSDGLGLSEGLPDWLGLSEALTLSEGLSEAPADIDTAAADTWSAVGSAFGAAKANPGTAAAARVRPISTRARIGQSPRRIKPQKRQYGRPYQTGSLLLAETRNPSRPGLPCAGDGVDAAGPG